VNKELPEWRRRCYAEHPGKPWWILSAKHGLLAPNLGDQTSAYRGVWGERVLGQFEESLGSLQWHVIEVHAGRTA